MSIFVSIKIVKFINFFIYFRIRRFLSQYLNQKNLLNIKKTKKQPKKPHWTDRPKFASHPWIKQSHSVLFIKLEATKMSDTLFIHGHELHFLESSEAHYCLRNLPKHLISQWRAILSSDRTDRLARKNNS